MSEEVERPAVFDPWAGLDLALLPPKLAGAAAAYMTAIETFSAAVAARDVDGPQAELLAALLAAGAGRSSALGACLLPVVEADGMWAAGGSKSFAIWVAEQHHLAVQTARAQVRLGRALRDHLPLTAAAVAEGRVTVEQARILAQLGPTTEQRRDALADPVNETNEAFLVQTAQQVRVDELRLVMRRWAAHTDPDADDRGYVEASDREHLEITRLGDMVDVSGQVTISVGQALKAALAALTPVRAPDDTRSASQRRAHALGDVCRVALDAERAGGRRRTVRHRLGILVPYATLQDLVTGGRTRCGTQAAIATRGESGTLDEIGTRSTRGAQGPVRSPSFATRGNVTGTDVVGGPQYEDGTPISRTELDLACCDSEFARYVFGANSEVLDVGRTQRTFTCARRDALIARDKHCRYPGCTAPPILCDGHHLDEWVKKHGRTAVRRGLLLCTFHHGLVHRKSIQITLHGRRFAFTDRHGHEITGDPHRVSRT